MAPEGRPSPSTSEPLELPEGFKPTELGPLPEEWDVVRLSEVCRITSGGSAPQGQQYFVGTNPFVRVQHLDRDSATIRSWDLITDEAVRKHGLRRFPTGTIVFPKSGASIRLEKRAILPVDSYVVSHLCAILPDPRKVSPPFLYYALRAVRFAAEKADGYPTLGLREIGPTRIPFPTLDEQRAIAGVLGTIQRATEATERVIAAARELKRSLMRHLFTYGPVPLAEAARVPLKETDLGPVPEHWETVKLGDVVTSGPQNGLYKPAGFYGAGVPIVRINDFDNEGRFLPRPLLCVQLNASEVDRYGLFASDILVNRVNSLSHLGKVAIVPSLDLPTVFESNMMRCRVDEDRVSSQFIFRLLALPRVRERMREMAKRAVAHSSINQGDVKSLPAPIPPPNEQHRITQAIRAVDCKVEAEEQRRAALKALFRTTLHRLMTGRVRVSGAAMSAWPR